MAAGSDGTLTTSDPAPAARRLLDDYLAIPYNYPDRIKDSAEGRAILESLPAVQVALIHAALDGAIEEKGPVSTDWHRRWRQVELARALLRRRQPLTEADVRRLLQWAANSSTKDGSWFHGAMPDILRAVSRYAAEHGLPAGAAAALQKLRAGALTAGYSSDCRKAVALIDALLGDDATTEGGDQDQTDPPHEGAGKPDEAVPDDPALHEQAQTLLLRYLADAESIPDAHSWAPDPRHSPAGRQLSDAQPPLRAAVLESAIAALAEHLGRNGEQRTPRLRALDGLVEAFVRQAGDLQTGEIRHALRSLERAPILWLHMYHARNILAAILHRVEVRRLVPRLRAELAALRAAGDPYTGQYRVREILTLIDRLLASGRPSLVEAVDTWGRAARSALGAMDESEHGRWLALLSHAHGATGARPSKRWLDRAQPLLEVVGAETYTARVAKWLGFLSIAPPPLPPGVPAGPISPLTLTDSNAALLKGLVWLCALVERAPLAATLAEAADRCFAKPPGAGPRAIGVGNACIQALATVEGIEGALNLQWLRHRVSYIPAVKLIDGALNQAAQQAGVDRAELEERLVPDFGLTDGRRLKHFGDYRAELALGGASSVELRWFKAGGASLRAVPATVRRDSPEELADLKRTAEEIRKTLPVQRARIEGMFLAERCLPLGDWRARYLDHGLLSQLSRRLIWRFGEGGDARAGAWLDGRIVDAEDRPLAGLADAVPVRLWHPIAAAAGAVAAWRDWLERHGVTQPFKQAHRELYVITDAERQTRVYSNRFAAHILRQHQMHALAQQRGWKAPLAMVYDGGSDATLSLSLGRWNLRAEYFVEAVIDDDIESSYNDNGVCHFVSTDQVRFTSPATGEPVPLADIPALVVSEVMRDVDLFVGVASVGNDPTWRDAGPERHRTYWERYSFGELTEPAKTRRAVLERLLPRLTALAGRWSLTDRFLVIRGGLRSYKIHLGSGNILMEPNNQYLCIVPARGGAGEDGLFLPFEGDAMLSVILSKAFLLAKDSAITDPTITRQIALR